MVIYRVILLGSCEFLEVESHWSSWSWFLFAVCLCGWWIPLVQDGACADLQGIYLKFELSGEVWFDEYWCVGDSMNDFVLGF